MARLHVQSALPPHDSMPQVPLLLCEEALTCSQLPARPSGLGRGDHRVHKEPAPSATNDKWRPRWCAAVGKRGKDAGCREVPANVTSLGKKHRVERKEMAF